MAKNDKQSKNKAIMWAAIAGAVVFLVLVYLYVSWGVEEEAFTSEVEPNGVEAEE